jgi:hypothetical protein
MAYEGPRFRRDLISTVFYEGGVRCVDVHDPKRGATFRLFDYEYSVALAFDGRDLGKVISWVRVSTGLELNEEQLTSFARRLDQLGFLDKPKAEGEVTPPPVVPGETPTPLLVPVPRVPVPAPPHDENTPPPEAGSLATSTRPNSGERLASTGSTPEPEPAAAETPESELGTPSEEASEPAEPALAEAVSPEEIAAVPEEIATVPEEVVASPEEAPEAPAAELPEWPEKPTEAPLAAQEPEGPSTEEVTAPEPAPAEERAPEPALPEERAPEEATLAEAAPAPTSSSSEPELPVAVGPSPERPRERPAQRSARLPADANSASPASRRQVTPPPIPRGHLTPTPAPVTGVGRGPWMLSALFGTLAALVVGAVVAPFALGTRPPAPVSVRVLRVKPAEIVRWLEATAPIEAMPLQTLTFPVGGKVLRIASPGLELRPGDMVAATDAARSALDDWSRAQEQLAFAKQLVEGLRDSDDQKKVASAEAAVKQKTAQQERTLATLSKLAIIAKETGTVEQTLASLGQTVQAGGTAVRVRLPGWCARFELHRLPAAQLRKQGLCLAEISGRPVPCSFVPEEGDDTHLVISLPADAVSSAGLLLHLARSRTQDAFVLPKEALSDSNGKPRVLVVAPNGRAEMRSVVLADLTPVDAVVTQGLDPGDAVVVGSAGPVGAGTRVRISVED